MDLKRREFLLAGTATAAIAMAAGVPAFAQQRTALSPASNAPSAGEWKSYGGDLGITLLRAGIAQRRMQLCRTQFEPRMRAIAELARVRQQTIGIGCHCD